MYVCSLVLLPVMDMVKFRTIFFELLVFFTFTLLTLPFRLLTNKGTHQTKRNTDISERPIDDGAENETQATVINCPRTPPWNPTPPPSRPQEPVRE